MLLNCLYLLFIYLILVFSIQKKVGVRQYENSDSKSGVCFREGFRCLLVITKRYISSFEANHFSLMKHLKISLEMISKNCRQNGMFFHQGESLSSETLVLLTQVPVSHDNKYYGSIYEK